MSMATGLYAHQHQTTGNDPAATEANRRHADERGKTILMVTHEALGAAYADRILVLKDGRVVGTLEPKGTADAALVATGYQELAG